MDKRLIKLVLIGLVMMIVPFANAQNEELTAMKNVESFKIQLNKISKSTSSIQSVFIQEKALSVLDEKIFTRGKFYFKSPGKLRWEYTEPFEYLIVLNGESVIIKDEDRVSKYDIQSNNVFKEINDLMIELVQGKVLDNEKYQVGYFENGKEYILDLIPDQEGMRAFLSNIYVYIDQSDYSVVGIKMVESSGDYTRISFSEKLINPQISDEVFIIN